MASALKLLEQRSYKEISVLDIVADSGVNRNTFYYHFRDMPALVETLACRSVDRIFCEKGCSLREKLHTLVDTLYENRRIVMHVYGSAERVIFDKCLDKVCERLSICVFENSAELLAHGEEERRRQFVLCKACCYGLFSDWLLKAMDDSGRMMLHSLCDEYVDKI